LLNSDRLNQLTARAQRLHLGKTVVSKLKRLKADGDQVRILYQRELTMANQWLAQLKKLNQFTTIRQIKDAITCAVNASDHYDNAMKCSPTAREFDVARDGLVSAQLLLKRLAGQLP
jgi:hypothetical protein